MRRDPNAGLTLVETLVAMTIVASMASLGVLSLAGLGRSADARGEAVALAAQLQDAADTALATSRRFVLETTPGGYAILPAPPRAERAGETEDRTVFAERTLPGRIRIVQDGRDAPAPVVGGVFARPSITTLRGDGETWTVRFDGLRATVSQETERAGNARE